MEIEQLMKMIVFIVILATMSYIIIYLFKGKGGELLNSIRETMRFG